MATREITILQLPTAEEIQRAENASKGWAAAAQQSAIDAAAASGGGHSLEEIRDDVARMFQAGANTTVTFDDTNDTIRINATVSGGGGTPATEGFIRASDPQFGMVPYDPDLSASEQVLNDLTPLTTHMRNNPGKWVRFDYEYVIGSTDLTGLANWKDQDLLIFGTGGLITSGPTAIRAIASYSPEIRIGSIGLMSIGDSDDRRQVDYVDFVIDAEDTTEAAKAVKYAELQKFQGGMVWQTFAKPISKNVQVPGNRSGFYPWSLPGTYPGQLTGQTVMAEPMTVLGTSYLVTPDATNAIVENNVVVGMTSKATMVVAYAVDENGSRRVNTERVFGTFQNNEQLRLVTQSASMDMTTEAGRTAIRDGATAGKTVGKINARGRILFTESHLARFDQLDCPIFLRKAGGSRGGYATSTRFPVGDYFSNLRCDIRGITIRPLTDPSAFATVRGAAVTLGNFVNYRVSDVTVTGAYRNAFQIASCYNGWASGILIDMLPNNAVQKVDGYGYSFGYGFEYIGACGYCVLSDSRISNVRHAVTQNSQANSQWLSELKDTVLHGTQKHVITKNVIATNCVSAAFDSHYGAQFMTFDGCRGYYNRGEGRTDSGGPIYSNRSWNTRYINCHSVGGLYGFSDPTAGFKTGSDDGTTDTRFPTETLYVNCTATNYAQYGFRQGLRSQSGEHSVRWINCYAEDGRKAGSGAGGVYDTSGWLITGVNAILDGCSSGSQNLAAVRFYPGSWINSDNTPKIVNADGTTTTSPVSASLKVINGFHHNQSENVLQSTSVFAIDGGVQQGEITLDLASDIVVNGRRVNGLPTAQAIRHMSGNPTIRWGGSVKTMGANPITDYRSTDQAGGVTQHNLMPGAQPGIHFGSSRPNVSYAGRIWNEPNGSTAIYNGTSWIKPDGSAKPLSPYSDPDLLGLYDADALGAGPVPAWGPTARNTGAWGEFKQSVEAARPVAVTNVVNGHNAVGFTSSTKQWIDLQHDDITSPTSMIIVFKAADVPGTPVVSSITSGTGRGAIVSTTGDYLAITASGTPGGFASTKTFTEEWRVVTLVWNGKQSRVYDNSTTPTSGELDTNTSLNLAQSVRLGRGSGGSTTFGTIQVATVAAFNRALNASDVVPYMQQLAARYGITLS